MGYIVEHSIVVTSWDGGLLKQAHEYAVSVGAQVTSIVDFAINSGGAFLVAPDGSKEGWSESERGDERRALIKTWLADHQYSDGSNSLKWYEVEWPDDKNPKVSNYEHPAPGTELREYWEKRTHD